MRPLRDHHRTRDSLRHDPTPLNRGVAGCGRNPIGLRDALIPSPSAHRPIDPQRRAHVEDGEVMLKLLSRFVQIGGTTRLFHLFISEHLLDSFTRRSRYR